MKFGSTSSDDIFYAINSLEDLQTLCNVTNGQNLPIDTNGLTFKLTADLYLDGGNYCISKNNDFNGTFDGQGHVISNFSGTLINNSDGTVKNLVLMNVSTDNPFGYNGNFEDNYFYSEDINSNDASKFAKINAIKVNGEAISSNTYTVEGDIEVTVEGYPKIDGLTFDNDGEYYEISSIEDLQTFASYVNGGNSCEGLTFKLTADLNSTGDNFTAISGFKGTFDGNGHLIITDSAIFSGDTGTISGGYYYGTSGRGFTQVFKVNVPSDVAVNANSDDEVTFGGEIYYKAGSNVTIDDENYTINADDYYCVDENGKNKIAAATILTDNATELGGGWYIVKGNVEIDHTLNFYGNANLILPTEQNSL